MISCFKLSRKGEWFVRLLPPGNLTASIVPNQRWQGPLPGQRLLGFPAKVRACWFPKTAYERLTTTGRTGLFAEYQTLPERRVKAAVQKWVLQKDAIQG